MTHCNTSILLIRQGPDTEKTIKGQKSALSGRNSQRAVGRKSGKSLKQLGISGSTGRFGISNSSGGEHRLARYSGLLLTFLAAFDLAVPVE
jgi:hypothetical protein